MQILTGGTGDHFQNNHIHLNANGAKDVTITTTPGGPVLSSSAPPVPTATPAAEQTVVATASAPPVTPQLPSSESHIFRGVSPIHDIHTNITTIGDLLLSEYSPSQPEYKQLLQEQAKYYNDYYPEHYNQYLTPQQNIAAFKHFEETQKVNLGINTETEGCDDYEYYSSKMVKNIENGNKNIKFSDSDSKIKDKFNQLMKQNEHLLKKSFEYALKIIPNNHNKPINYSINNEEIRQPFDGLLGGMPRGAGRDDNRNKNVPRKKKKTKRKKRSDESDSGMFLRLRINFVKTHI